MFAALLPILSSLIGPIAQSLFPNPEEETKRQQFQNQFVTQLMQQAQAIELAAADVVKVEAASNHWLAANWRPLTMLVFVGLVVARWMGWTAPGMSEAEYLSIYDLIKIGLGGYVVGRSAEKIVPAVAAILKKQSQ